MKNIAITFGFLSKFIPFVRSFAGGSYHTCTFPQIIHHSYSSSIQMSASKQKKLDIKIPKQLLKYTPATKNQERYVEYLQNPKVKIVCGIGSTGSGKTLFACSTSIYQLFCGNIDKIIITRPLTSVDDENIGFLPGSLNEKMDVWTRPIFDIFHEFYSVNEIQHLLSTGKIEISPLAYMRGRTFKNAIIIADEMQNSSPNQMLMMTTRIGDSTKLIMTGDLKQTDRSGPNGLSDFIQRFSSWKQGTDCCVSFDDDNQIEIVEFEEEDIQRSSIVRKIYQIYQYQVPVLPAVSTSTNAVFMMNSTKKTTIENDAAIIPRSKYLDLKQRIFNFNRIIRDDFDFIPRD